MAKPWVMLLVVESRVHELAMQLCSWSAKRWVWRRGLLSDLPLETPSVQTYERQSVKRVVTQSVGQPSGLSSGLPSAQVRGAQQVAGLEHEWAPWWGRWKVQVLASSVLQTARWRKASWWIEEMAA
jgi:hypothetical protein